MQAESVIVNISILGSLSADLRGYTITPSAAKQRQILALLALNHGRLVTVPTLIEELWGDNPPRSCATTLQTYILQLRNRITSAIPADMDVRDILSRQYNGYLLERSSCQIDVDDFERLARAGRTSAEAGDYRVASETLSEALRLWRGPALVDIPMGQLLELQAASLEEMRLGVLERRIEADLALGRHADLIGELRVLTAASPLNENYCGFFITALYRSGNPGRALEEFRRLRGTLRTELGMEPSPKLQQLQQAILTRDPGLEADTCIPPLVLSQQWAPGGGR